MIIVEFCMKNFKLGFDPK